MHPITLYLLNKVQIQHDLDDGINNDAIEYADTTRDVVAIVGAVGHTCDDIKSPHGTVKCQQESPDIIKWAFNAGNFTSKEERYNGNADDTNHFGNNFIRVWCVHF